MRAAAGGGFIVILRNEFRDGLGEFVAESRPVRWRPEANLGIDRQGRQAFARLCRPTNEVGHLADDSCAQGDEIARGQPIDFPIRINGDRAQGARGLVRCNRMLGGATPPTLLGRCRTNDHRPAAGERERR